jgi:hypothetical protein
MRDTKYARELAVGRREYESGDQVRIERLFIKDLQQEEIRFSWWKGSRMVMRPLDLPEDDLLELFEDAMHEGVFSQTFLRNLRALLPGE